MAIDLETLPESLNLNPEAVLQAKLALASNFTNQDTVVKHDSVTWTPASHPELEVKTDLEKDKYDHQIREIARTAFIYVNPKDHDAGFYTATDTTNGLDITVPGEGRQAVPSSPEQYQAVVVWINAKLDSAIESATRPVEKTSAVISLLGRLANRSTELADAA